VTEDTLPRTRELSTAASVAEASLDPRMAWILPDKRSQIWSRRPEDVAAPPSAR
jgi:hypothetical protein